MTFKKNIWTIAAIASFVWCSFAQQQKNQVDSQGGILYDVYGKPYTEIITTLENSERHYYTLSGDTLFVKLNKNVEFIGGRDSLRAYIASIYYKHRDPGNDELNQLITLRVLLDSNLHVVESRILQRGYDAAKYPTLDSVFVAIMNSTGGHWQKVHDSDTSNYYIGGMVYRVY